MTDSKTPDWVAGAADDVWTALANNEANGREAEMALFSQALLSAYERGRAEREWQPIETAPKDGTVVLGYWSSSILPEGYMQPVHYDDGFQDKWVIHWDIGNAYPTHWMPLPAPPAKENANER